MIQSIALLSLGGTLSGLLAGLLGVGGGIVLVPLLTLVLPLLGIASNLAMHVAVATSMAVISITSIASAKTHWHEGQVVWRAFRHLTAGTIVGTLLGVNLASFLPGHILHIVFGVFTLVIAIRTLFDIKPKTRHDLPSSYHISAGGFIIGIACALLGMGGGALIVPYLSRYNLSVRQVIATSALCTMPIAWMGTLGFIYVGSGQELLENVKWATGYIYWPAFLVTAIAGFIFAPVGARLAHRLPTAVIKKIFGVFLVAVSAHMLTIGIMH